MCVPAYNRPGPLRELLESVATQAEADYEILIREDASPERLAIRSTVDTFRQAHPRVTTRYLENDTNLGYDGNLRALVDSACGEYCLFMGNDDLLAPDALAILAKAIRAYPETQVVLRTYATFDQDRARGGPSLLRRDPLLPPGHRFGRDVFPSIDRDLRVMRPSRQRRRTSDGSFRRHAVVSALPGWNADCARPRAVLA